VTKRPKRGGKQGRPTRVDASVRAASEAKGAEAEVVADKARPAAGSVDATIVGIGASAGGLAAFEAFFSAMPADNEPGIAFVLVQHLAPDHKSILSDLVRRFTAMPVLDVEEGMRLQPNSVYIIPPNRDMAVLSGRLHLLEPAAPRGLRLPIDFFFRSLAQDLHERAICIVFSGTGSDGTLGARAIKGEGGMVMAQAPESTEYDGMPRSVIATGLVDYVLPPADMPSQLVAFVARRFAGAHVQMAPATQQTEGALKRILVLLRAHTGHDFSQYKQRTILRRIERRMAVHQIEGLGQYLRYMQDAPGEADALFGDLLIGVTSFFRDVEAFKTLEEQVVSHLFDDKPAGTVLRVWAAGCSTGEEAYSLAILLQERIQALKQNYRVQFFATDVDRRAIDIARAGVYPANIAADVSSERLARFFVQDPADGSYRIHKTLRDMLVFSEQDVIKDPPFSKLDVIICRNVLIYMGTELHEKLIPLFHYALNPNGFLFLGSSETVGEFGHLFARVDRGSKLYRRREGDPGTHRPSIEIFLTPVPNERAPQPAARVRRGAADRLRELTEGALLQSLAGALVNERGDILYLHGRSGQYLELASGEPAMNILTMAREGLRHELTTALHDAVAKNAPVRHPGLVVRTNGEFRAVNLTVCPAEARRPHADSEPGLFVVILEDAPPARAPAAAFAAGEAVEGGPTGNADADGRIAALTRELRAKGDYLQTSNEELATSNEELKSSNEEMQSVNEELQSANEELETSKEELQSINEELATVNAELQTKMGDLSRANNDLNNLLAGTGMGTVFVDHQLRIQRFTPTITQVIKLIQTDLGRPVGDITTNLLGYDSLVRDIQAVLDSLTPREVEVQTRTGAWFLLRIRPYRTLENVIEGAVITFTDITDVKKAQMALLESEGLRRLAVVVRDSDAAILVQALGGRIVAWNPSAERMYGWTEAEALSMNILALIPEGQREVSLAKVREIVLGDVRAPYRAQRLTKDGRIVEVWLTAASLVDGSGEPYAIATTERAAGGGAP
jgi:two-component system, chemotaxis family, CheB/CheR fusion protein